MLSKIKKRLIDFEGNLPSDLLPQASVLVALTESNDPELIYTLRSKKVSSHSGEVAFPGGMKEEGDKTLEMTALRESFEEIGLDQKEVTVFGPLNTLVSRFNISVTPYVGSVPEDVVLTDESEEIDALFKVPISFLLKDDRFRNDPINRNGKVYYVPAYKYQSYVIWGLTAMITVDFLNLACDAGIDLSNPTIIKEKK